MSPAPRVVRNGRDGVDWNTCGQAAVATVLACYAAGPFARAAPPTDAQAIDAILRAFGPDLPFGMGTTAWRIRAALRAHDVDAEIVHSGLFGSGRERALDRLRAAVASGVPTPVCLDLGLLGGPAWSAHWAVALELDAQRVRLGNAGSPDTLPLDRFMVAWRCRHLPWSHNHCAVIPWGR